MLLIINKCYRKSFVFFSVLSVTCTLGCAQEKPPALIKKLDSLPNNESAALNESLPLETKDAIAKVRREESEQISDKIEAFDARKRELELRGTENFVNYILWPYQSLAKEVIQEIEDPREQEAQRASTAERMLKIGTMLYEAPAPLVIDLWEESRANVETTWKGVSPDSPTKEDLHKIEVELLDSLSKNLQKIIDGEPEKEAEWPSRKKWMHLFDSKSKKVKETL